MYVHAVCTVCAIVQFGCTAHILTRWCDLFIDEKLVPAGVTITRMCTYCMCIYTCKYLQYVRMCDILYVHVHAEIQLYKDKATGRLLLLRKWLTSSRERPRSMLHQDGAEDH